MRFRILLAGGFSPHLRLRLLPRNLRQSQLGSSRNWGLPVLAGSSRAGQGPQGNLMFMFLSLKQDLLPRRSLAGPGTVAEPVLPVQRDKPPA